MHIFAIAIFKTKKKTIMTLIRDTLCVAENNRVYAETLSKAYNANSGFKKNRREFVFSGKLKYILSMFGIFF